MNINKRYLKFGLGLSFVAVSLFSCTQDDVDYVTNADRKPTLTVNQASYTASEGDNVDITFTLSAATSVPVVVKFDVIDTETNQPINSVDSPYYNDFTIGSEVGIGEGYGYEGYAITIPAGVTTYTTSLETFLDDEFEETENIKLRFYIESNLGAKIVDGSNFIDVTLMNKASNIVSFTFAWDKTFDFGGTEYSLCDIGYDIDIYLFDAEGNQVDDNLAATGDCPEHFDWDLSAFAPGEYQFYANLYNDADGLSGAGITPAFEIPINVTYSRGGSATLNGSFTQSSDYAFTSDSAPSSDLNYIATATVNADGTVTLSDDNGTIATGRNGHLKNVAAALAKRKAQKRAAHGTHVAW